MKLCKDCKNKVNGDFSSPVYWACSALMESCREARQGYVNPISRDFTPGSCGPDAKFFEPLPPKRWWEFWK